MYSAIEAVGILFHSTMRMDAALQQLLPGGIHDGMVPDSTTATFPYLVIGEKVELPDNRLASFGRSVGIQIHIHSRYRGALEAAKIAARVEYLFDQGQNRLLLSGWALNSLQLEMNEEFTEDVDQRHRIVRFKVRCQPIL